MLDESSMALDSKGVTLQSHSGPDQADEGLMGCLTNRDTRDVIEHVGRQILDTINIKY